MGDPVSFVMENLETEPVLFDELAAEARKLWRDSEERRTRGDETIQRLVESIQLRIAVGSPVTAKKRENDRAFSEPLAQAKGGRLTVGKLERWGARAFAQRPGRGARVLKLGGRSVHALPMLLGNAVLGTRPDGLETLFQGSHGAYPPFHRLTYGLLSWFFLRRVHLPYTSQARTLSWARDTGVRHN